MNKETPSKLPALYSDLERSVSGSVKPHAPHSDPIAAAVPKIAHNKIVPLMREEFNKLGVPSQIIAMFEGYCTNNTPMTDEQMKAGIAIAAKLPSFRKGFQHVPLINGIIDYLHSRYATADGEEKSKLYWVCRAVFLSVYEKSLLNDFSKTLKGKSEDNIVDFQDRVDNCIQRCLERHDPEKGHVLALMYTATHNEIINVYRNVYGSRQNQERANFVNALSFETGGFEGGSMENIVPINHASVLDNLIERETAIGRANTLAMIARINPKKTRFPEQQARMVEHFKAQASGVEFPSTQRLAEEFSTSEGTIKTHKLRTYRKIVRLLHKTQSESGGVPSEDIISEVPHAAERSGKRTKVENEGLLNPNFDALLATSFVERHIDALAAKDSVAREK